MTDDLLDSQQFFRLLQTWSHPQRLLMGPATRAAVSFTCG